MCKKLIIVFCLIYSAAVVAGSATGKAAKNSLYQHASPYLAMHGRDPVKWQEWNQQTVEIARQQGKLLFVSSGYFSCHWCHVMQRESYQNDSVAALLNKHFIPVKVDRELNSALDANLIDFVERTQGQAGWPLNVFITPEGFPLVGFTYAPPDNFVQILNSLVKEWRTKEQELKDLAQAASKELSKAEVSQSTQLPLDLAAGMMQVFINQNFTYVDDLQGGYGQQNKFPSVPKLDTLLSIYKKNPDEQIKQFLNLTLQNMASQGLRDQLGGGFYRYVVDPNWQIPHFEKMLYDNALLASLYYQASIILDQPKYKVIADETLDFIMRELDTGSPAFAASLSAVDDKGIEGGYYLWDKDQLKNILTRDEMQVVSLFWGVSGGPDLEDGHHLIQAADIKTVSDELKISVAKVSNIIESAKRKMLKVRVQRSLPKDSKILTAWNGLTLSALIEGAKHKGNERYKVAAEQLVKTIRKQLWNQKTKTLYRASGKHGPLGDGTLEDYAYIAQGLFAWWQLSKKPEDKKLLEDILKQAWLRFYPQQGGQQGWQLAENMLLKYGSGQTMVSDSPMPSPSAVIIEISYHYARLSGDKPRQDQAMRALNVGFKQLQSDAFWYATQIKTILSVQ